MKERNPSEMVGKQEGKREPQPGNQIDKLFEQSDMVKMMSLQALMAMGREGGDEAVIARHSQMVMKAIEVQLRIIAEQAKQVTQTESALPRELWDALLEVPGVGPTLRQPRAREKFEDSLKKLRDRR